MRLAEPAALIGVDSVECDEVWGGFGVRALFPDAALRWDRLLPADDDRADSVLVGERDDEGLLLASPELLGPVGGSADESNVFIMACSSPDQSLEGIVQSEVARDRLYEGLKHRGSLWPTEEKVTFKTGCSRRWR